MSETVNIQKAAERVSKEIFGPFGWDLLSPQNINWECATPDHPEFGKSHPSDCVFTYTDPYSGNQVLVQSDLKNYQASSINPSKLKSYVSALARATDCARRSDAWQSKFASRDRQWSVVGLLFVFNNDGDYQQNLEEKFGAAPDQDFGIPAKTRVFSVSPQRVAYLASVASDILQRRGLGELPAPEHCHFHYPHLVNQKASHPYSDSATVESLLGPWILMRHQAPNKPRAEFTVYLNSPTLTRDYFHYLIDSLMRHQLVVAADQRIEIRAVASNLVDAATMFARARDEYCSLIPGGNANLNSLIRAITYRSINASVRHFNIEELGFGE